MLEDMMWEDIIPEGVQELMLEVAVMQVAMTQMNEELGNLANIVIQKTIIDNDICMKQTLYF